MGTMFFLLQYLDMFKLIAVWYDLPQSPLTDRLIAFQGSAHINDGRAVAKAFHVSINLKDFPGSGNRFFISLATIVCRRKHCRIINRVNRGQPHGGFGEINRFSRTVQVNENIGLGQLLSFDVHPLDRETVNQFRPDFGGFSIEKGFGISV